MKSIYEFYPELKNLIPFDKKFDTSSYKKTFDDTRTLSYSEHDNIEDYERFKSIIYDNLGLKYLPILRISDGELLLLTGIQNESRRASIIKRSTVYMKNIIRRILKRDHFILYSHIFGSFDHSTGHSETYKFNKAKYAISQINDLRQKFLSELKEISSCGILSVHFSYSKKFSLVEKFWINFIKMMKSNSIELSQYNCFPFYFVYMFLSDKSAFGKAIKNNRILCISSASGSKKDNIVSSILNYKPSNVDWLKIPTAQTFFYELESNNYVKNNYDLILLAAGTGKTNIIRQLKEFNCPVIDCGFYFEVWNNNKVKYNRIGCVRDDEY